MLYHNSGNFVTAPRISAVTADSQQSQALCGPILFSLLCSSYPAPQCIFHKRFRPLSLLVSAAITIKTRKLRNVRPALELKCLGRKRQAILMSLLQTKSSVSVKRLLGIIIIIISNLSNDRSKASYKTIPPHSAI